MKDPPERREPLPAQAHPNLPPLRIHHLMAWMATTAILISSCLWFDRTFRDGEPIENRLVIVSLILFAIAISCALTFFCCGVYWRLHAYAFPTEPGQWLLMFFGIGTLGFAAAVVLSLAVDKLVTYELFPFIWSGSRIALLIGLILTSLRVARRRSDTIPWRIMFYLLAAVPLLIALTGTEFTVAATLFSLLAAMSNDMRRGIVRHWSHWFGIAALLMICLSCGVISVFPTAEHWPASSWLR